MTHPRRTERTDDSRAGKSSGEPDRDLQRADVGGIPANADAGVQEALQRHSERLDDDATGAKIGSATTGGPQPRVDLGGKPGPGSASSAPAPRRSGAGGAVAGSASTGTAGPAPGAGFAKRKAAAPVTDEPTDEGAAESFGRAVSEVVTGPLQDREEHDQEVPHDRARRPRQDRDTPPRGR